MNTASKSKLTPCQLEPFLPKFQPRLKSQLIVSNNSEPIYLSANIRRVKRRRLLSIFDDLKEVQSIMLTNTSRQEFSLKKVKQSMILKTQSYNEKYDYNQLQQANFDEELIQ